MNKIAITELNPHKLIQSCRIRPPKFHKRSVCPNGVVGKGVDKMFKKAEFTKQLEEGSNLPCASVFFKEIEVKSRFAKPTLETRLCL